MQLDPNTQQAEKQTLIMKNKWTTLKVPCLCILNHDRHFIDVIYYFHNGRYWWSNSLIQAGITKTTCWNNSVASEATSFGQRRKRVSQISQLTVAKQSRLCELYWLILQGQDIKARYYREIRNYTFLVKMKRRQINKEIFLRLHTFFGCHSDPESLTSENTLKPLETHCRVFNCLRVFPQYNYGEMIK